MALQRGAIREALLSAGAPSEKADKTAEELAGYEHRLATIELRLNVLMFMVAALYALGGLALWLLIRLASKAGAIG
jgi:hypothetical protein